MPLLSGARGKPGVRREFGIQNDAVVRIAFRRAVDMKTAQVRRKRNGTEHGAVDGNGIEGRERFLCPRSDRKASVDAQDRVLRHGGGAVDLIGAVMRNEVHVSLRLQCSIGIADEGETAEHLSGMIVDQDRIRVDDDLFITGKRFFLHLSRIADITVQNKHFFPSRSSSISLSFLPLQSGS